MKNKELITTLRVMTKSTNRMDKKTSKLESKHMMLVMKSDS